MLDFTFEVGKRFYRIMFCAQRIRGWAKSSLACASSELLAVLFPIGPSARAHKIVIYSYTEKLVYN